MRWCVLGASGQIGSVAAEWLVNSGLVEPKNVVALGRNDLDITDTVAVNKALDDFGPAVVLNAAAYTNVDGAESEQKLATLVNETAPAVLARLCQNKDIKFIHISTDYVFDGSATRPYLETDEADPLSFYGQTKLRGELLVLTENPTAWVVRTSWVYAPGFQNFPTAILSRLRKGQKFDVVDDQIGTPTSAKDLVTGLFELANTTAPAGVYHLTNQGQASWFEFAKEIAESSGFDSDLVQATSTAHSQKLAVRPKYSVLETQKWLATGLRPLSGWQQAWQLQAPNFQRVDQG